MYEYKWLLFAFLSLFSLVANYMLNRSLSSNYSPFLALAVTGFTQTIICLVVFAFSNETISKFGIKNLAFSILLGICVILVDYAMITAYNLGGNSVVITLIVSMATVVVLPISYFIFKESISIIQLGGIILSIISIIMVVGFPKK